MKGAPAAGLSLLLTACTVGPDYRLPTHAVATTTSATQPFASAHESVFSPEALPAYWWQLYRDPQLDRYVTEGLAANYDLRAADANLRQATFIVREAEAGRLPTTTLSATAGLSRGLASGVSLANAGSYELGGSIGYPLDLAGGISRGIEAARDSAQAAEAVRDETRVTIAAAITRTYAAACSANRTLSVTQHVLEVQRQTLDVTQRLFRGGRGTAFDVTRAKAAVNQSAAAIPSILSDRQTSLYELAVLLGRAPAEYPKEVERCANPPVLERRLPTGDGASLIRRRPDLRQAERTLAAATATIGVETAQLYPQVSLGGSAELAGPAAALAGGAEFGVSIGPLVTWTFPNRSLAKARIAAAGALAEAAAAQFDAAVLEALQQTESALTAYARELDHDRALTAVRDDDTKAASQADRLFRLGATGFLDLLTAQANLAAAEVALATSQASVSDRQIDVFLALGGGWE
jgi:NodT family efflux transporter outer membrane factor (OMF) lipoprotein